MTGDDDDTRVSQLLAPLKGLEPLTLPGACRERRRVQRTILVAVVLACALTGAGVAIATGLGPFRDIGSANRPQDTSDRLDPEMEAFLRRAPMKIEPDSVRLVGQLPSGRRFYVATDVEDDLCVIVEQQMAGCGPGLTRDRPITVASMRSGASGEQPISYGVAVDGVTAVSFVAGGRQVTVPVTDNVWAYEGASSALRSTTAHFLDGTSVVLTP